MERTLLVALFSSAFLANADPAKPLARLPLNEGDSAAIREVASDLKLVFLNPELTEWVAGPNGEALYFRVGEKVPERPLIYFNRPEGFDLSKAFTVLVTIKTPAALARSRQYEIFRYCDGGKDPGVRIFLGWGAFWLYAGNGEELSTLRTNGAELNVTPDTWYSLAVTYDGSDARIYLDGAFQAEETSFGIMNPERGPSMCVGASGSGPAQYSFEGVISNLRLYDQALSAEEIALIYRQE